MLKRTLLAAAAALFALAPVALADHVHSAERCTLERVERRDWIPARFEQVERREYVPAEFREVRRREYVPASYRIVHEPTYGPCGSFTGYRARRIRVPGTGVWRVLVDRERVPGTGVWVTRSERVQVAGTGAWSTRVERRWICAPIAPPAPPIVEERPVDPAPAPRLRPIRVTGYGAPRAGWGGPQGRLLAMRAARLDAMRKLAETLLGLQIDSTTTVRDMVTERDEIATRVQGFVRGARELDARILPDGTAQVTLELDPAALLLALRRI